MADHGRVLVRASGTEPLLRVMVEAADQAQVDHGFQVLAAEAERGLVGRARWASMPLPSQCSPAVPWLYDPTSSRAIASAPLQASPTGSCSLAPGSSRLNAT